MAKRFLTDINLAGNQLINAAFEKLTADPTTGNFEGRLYYNTVSDILKLYTGSEWTAVGAITNVQGTTDEVDVVVSNGVATVSLPATINANTTGNAATATKLATTRAIELSGDVTGTANFDGSAAINISTTIAANSVALGTDTTGDYVASVSASNGINATGIGENAAVALTNTDKGSSQNIFKNVAVDGVTIVADNNDDTITFAAGTGIGLAGNATTDTLTISNTGVTSIAGTTNQISASGSTGSVTVSLPSSVVFPGTVTLNADPTQALHAATKQYVDNVSQGLHVHAPCTVATTGTLTSIISGTVTYSNGTAGVGATLTLQNALTTLDGITLQNGNRILVKNEATLANNGIYTWATGGTVLTRAADYDTPTEMAGGDFTFVQNGTLYNDTGWVMTDPVLTIGTDSVNFVQFSGAGTYTAGNGLTLNGTAFSINTAITADINSAQTFTNKTLTSPTITNPTVSGLYLSDNNIVIEGTADAFETTLVFTDPTADRTITFKDASGTVAYTSDITTAVGAITTTTVPEGTNLYYTDERAQDAIGNNLGSGFIYNDAAGSIGVNQGQMTTLVVTGASGNSYGLVGNSLYLDAVTPSGYNSEIELDITAVETKLKTDGFTKKISTSVGNASATSFGVTHNLATRDVQVQVYDNATYDTVECDVVRTDTNTVTVSFSSAPALNAYRVVVVG